MEESNAEKVHGLMMEVLFTREEAPNNTPPEDAVIVEGVLRNFGLHKGRLEEIRPKVLDLIETIVPEDFYQDKGGGGSFLSLAVDREDALWAEHQTLESFIVLALGLGLAGYCAPREMWPGLPCGMPYIWFKRRGSDAQEAAKPMRQVPMEGHNRP